MDIAALEENEFRFSYSLDSPSMQEPLLSELGVLGISEHTEDILNGTYQCPPETACFRRALVLSHLLMSHAENDGSLVDEQDGSRKHRHSAKTALKKVLFFDLLRQLRKAGSLTSNDARNRFSSALSEIAGCRIRWPRDTVWPRRRPRTRPPDGIGTLRGRCPRA